MANRTRFAGMYNAADYAFGSGGGGNLPNALYIDNATPIVAGAATAILATGQVQLTDGTILYPLATTCPLLVGTGSNQETVTPSAVTNPATLQYDVSSFTATFANGHGKGDPVLSGTYGLQEAINDCNSRGGGTVIVDAGWAAMGGTSAMIAAATIPAGTNIQDNRGSSVGITNAGILTVRTLVSNALVKTLFSVGGVPILAAPGAGNYWDVIDWTLENKFLTAAFTSGGAIQLTYGASGVTIPASVTIAATFLTSPAANQIIKAAGALATNLSSAILNAPVTMNAATADFATGAGSLVSVVTARLISGF